MTRFYGLLLHRVDVSTKPGQLHRGETPEATWDEFAVHERDEFHIRTKGRKISNQAKKLHPATKIRWLCLCGLTNPRNLGGE